MVCPYGMMHVMQVLQHLDHSVHYNVLRHIIIQQTWDVIVYGKYTVGYSYLVKNTDLLIQLDQHLQSIY